MPIPVIVPAVIGVAAVWWLKRKSDAAKAAGTSGTGTTSSTPAFRGIKALAGQVSTIAKTTGLVASATPNPTDGWGPIDSIRIAIAKAKAAGYTAPVDYSIATPGAKALPSSQTIIPEPGDLLEYFDNGTATITVRLTAENFRGQVGALSEGDYITRNGSSYRIGPGYKATWAAAGVNV